MHRLIRIIPLLLLALPLSAYAESASVAVFDGGSKIGPSGHECKSGHDVQRQQISIDSGKIRYAFSYSGCVDPSHGDLRPSAEGNFGMPSPWVGNWYWGGFIGVPINGQDAIKYKLLEMRILESGARGSFQAVWEAPDAIVGLRVMMLPGANHVMCDLSWKPRPDQTIKTVGLNLRCYPSFFTSSKNRQGERHCQTPRIDLKEPQTLDLVPKEDTYLYYYDTVFDVAKGEGEGPCAAMIAPDALAGGKVTIGGYSEDTALTLKPEAGHVRFALYDFNKQTNAAAEAYLKANAAADLARLEQTDFRPLLVREMDLDKFRADSAKLLLDAADDGKAMQPKVAELLTKIGGLKTRADAGDWQAEADMATALRDSEELFWRLKIFAALNAPQ